MAIGSWDREVLGHAQAAPTQGRGGGSSARRPLLEARQVAVGWRESVRLPAHILGNARRRRTEFWQELHALEDA